MGLLDGTDAAPPKTVEVEDLNKNKVQAPNPDYVAWIARDQLVMRWLLNSLSPDILSHLLEVESTADDWTAINGMFTTASRTKAQHLRGKLNDTKKLTMTADQYYTKMKGFASKLLALGKPIDDDELLGYLLHGLEKDDYNPHITSVQANPGTTLEDFFEQLSSYDLRNGVKENGTFISSANLARRAADQRQQHGRTPPPRGHSPDNHGPYRGGGNGDRRDDYRDRRRDDNWRRDDDRRDRDRRDQRPDSFRRRDDSQGRP
jgi:hypothetical protein